MPPIHPGGPAASDLSLDLDKGAKSVESKRPQTPESLLTRAKSLWSVDKSTAKVEPQKSVVEYGAPDAIRQTQTIWMPDVVKTSDYLRTIRMMKSHASARLSECKWPADDKPVLFVMAGSHLIKWEVEFTFENLSIDPNTCLPLMKKVNLLRGIFDMGEWLVVLLLITTAPFDTTTCLQFDRGPSPYLRNFEKHFAAGTYLMLSEYIRRC
jgi:hypothetical protein